jgi:hypothetical protein
MVSELGVGVAVRRATTLPGATASTEASGIAAGAAATARAVSVALRALPTTAACAGRVPPSARLALGIAEPGDDRDRRLRLVASGK